jgi:ATP-binding cassette subfamily B protein
VRGAERPVTRPPDEPAGAVRRSLGLIGRGLRAEPRSSALAIVASSFWGGALVLSGWLIGRATARVVVPAVSGASVSHSQIWLTGGVLLAVGLGTAVSVVIRRVYAGIAVYDIEARHRRAVTRQYLRLPVSWHRQHPTGQLLSNASSDADAAAAVFTPLPWAIGVVVMIVVAGVAMIAADPVLGLTGLGVLPAVGVINWFYQRHMSPAVARAQHERAHVTDAAHESFEAALVVKSLGTERRETARFSSHVMRLREANIAQGYVRSVFEPLMDALPSLGTLAVLAVGAVRVKSGTADAGDVVTTAYLLGVMASPVRAVGYVLGELPRSLVGWDRVSRVLRATGAAPAGSAELVGSGGLRVEVTDVSVEVSSPDAIHPAVLLDGISWTIPAGRTVAVVGPTGAGKSTLAQLLARLIEPSAGRVLIDGIELRELSDAARTSAIALVSQGTFIFDDTIRGNVALADPDDPAGPSDEAVESALNRAQAARFVAELPSGIETEVGERGASLSGGQRQRIALARALVRRPRLLILDDATSAVDPMIEGRIMSALRDADDTTTIILIAYRLATILLADEVVHLDRGRLVDHGTHSELMARDAGYRELATAYLKASERPVATGRSSGDGRSESEDES